MSHTPHELETFFEDDLDRFHKAKAESAHLRHLAERYHELNREVHRAETDIEPVADYVLEDMKKRRLALLDEITAIVHEF